MALSSYINLTASFVEGNMPAEEFMRRYFELFKKDPTMETEEAFQIQNKLFMDADDFEPDDDLRGEDPDWIDATEFRRRAAEALGKLRAIEAKRSSGG